MLNNLNLGTLWGTLPLTLSAHNTGQLHLHAETESGDEDVQGAKGTKDKI